MTKEEKYSHCKKHAPELLAVEFWANMKKELEFLDRATSQEMAARYNWEDKNGIK